MQNPHQTASLTSKNGPSHSKRWANYPTSNYPPGIPISTLIIEESLESPAIEPVQNADA